jgi:hypothetical protein
MVLKTNFKNISVISWRPVLLVEKTITQMLSVRISPRRGVLDTTLCDKVCQWLATARWFSDHDHDVPYPPLRYGWLSVVEHQVQNISYIPIHRLYVVINPNRVCSSPLRHSYIWSQPYPPLRYGWLSVVEHQVENISSCLMVFNATFNNISVISWGSVLSVFSISAYHQ